MNASQRLSPRLETRQRMAIFGRLRMADLVHMPEKEFSQEIEKIEKDPLFQKLFFGSEQLPSAIRRHRWPRGQLSGRFYEMNERLIAKGDRVQVDALLEGRRSLVELIRKIGKENFERYFIHAEEPLTLPQIAERTGMDLADVRSIHAFLLEMGSRAEFELPNRDPGAVQSYACLAKISLDDGEPVFEFLSPYWARGLYQLRYEMVEKWKDKGELGPEERKRLPRLLKKIEAVNLRQNTLFRILESAVKIQAPALGSGKEEDKTGISLRQLARRLDLAPSTISRALAGRSVLLPQGREVPLITLVPGRRKVVREILARWLAADKTPTDQALAERLKNERAIRISRRTVNAVRHEVMRS